MIELPEIVLTINPSLFLINSPLEEALKIEELKLLYGDRWPSIYKDIVAKQRLEDNFNKDFNYMHSKKHTAPINNKCICKESSNNVCS